MKMPQMADHMKRQVHRQIYAEDILTLNEGAAAMGAGRVAAGEAGGASDGGAAAGAVPSPAGGASLMPVALQAGERGPEVSNLQTDASTIFHAVRCGFARAHELLTPLGEEAPDGWAVALEVFPDEALEEAVASIKELRRQEKERKRRRE